MSNPTETLRAIANHLLPRRSELLDNWSTTVAALLPNEDEGLSDHCARALGSLLERLAVGELEEFLEGEAQAAAEAAGSGSSLHPAALAIRALPRCCLPFLSQAIADPHELAEALLALDELGQRRMELLLTAQDEESARRLIEAQNQATRAEEKAHELASANEALRGAEEQSVHRADQIGLIAAVARRIAGILEPDVLLQEAASTIQGRMGHRYVAVVVLDEKGVLVGRWAGKPGVGRKSSGKAEGPPGGVIGRALRKLAPQVVNDVAADPDYHADVSGTRSELVVPLLGQGRAIGVLDFQSERRAAFDLDAVAAGEAIAEFVVVALHNARLVEQLRQARSGETETPAE